MALYPCTVCLKRYAGKSNKGYIGWNRGGYSDRQVLDLCGRHVDELRETVQRQGRLLERDEVLVDDSPVAEKCTLCTVDATSTTWWAHIYDRTVGKEVYVTDACDQCRPDYASFAVEASRKPKK
jgi:hypothetical protein